MGTFARMSAASEMSAVSGEWKTGLFGCFDDVPGCCFGYCCFPCQYGMVTDIVTGQGMIVPCLIASCCPLCTQCCIAPGRRADIRKNLDGLPEAPFGDCLVWVCCPLCAGCQEARELKLRGVTDYTVYSHSSKEAPGAA